MRLSPTLLSGTCHFANWVTFWNMQMFSSQLVSADNIYNALLSGCALTGPSGCAAASDGDGPLEIDAKFQTLLTAAYDATKVKASVPVTSGNIRCEHRMMY